MNYEEITLNQLFRHPDFHSDKFSEIEIQDKIVYLKNEIQRKEPRLKWKNTLNEVLVTSSKLLDMRLKDILERAWGKYSEVQKFLNVEEFGVDEVFMVALHEHTITSVHHPKIEIRLGEVYIGAIDFDLQLRLVLSGIILKISQGKIQGVKAGKCKSKGNFSCEGVTLFEEETLAFSF